ncbi:MAG: helix-turn-helix transcriptional regulator [Butyricicoccus sp.]|nr:helix-turn-helix transcriptional regulator [Butyricicoccus sp.]
MTIGERIAALRRGHDLSQEALGEALGVSRQAISKWEADASLPEIDKLVALSRMFGVTIGELLGVEEAKPGVQEPRAEEPAAAPDELSEQQIHMIEEIAARYIDALPDPAPKKVSRKKLVLGVVAGVLVCAVVIGQFTGMRREIASLRNLTNNLQNNVSHISGNVGSQIDSITNRVEEVLKAQNDLTAEYRCEITHVDIRNERVSIAAYAVPKRYVEGMTTEYIVETDGYKEVIPADPDTDGKAFTCPLKNEIKVSVRFTADGVQETQLLEVFEGLVAKTLPDIFFDFSFLLWNEKIDRFAQPPREYDIHTHYYWGFTEASAHYQLTEPQVWLEINGEKLALETTGAVQTEEESLVDVTAQEAAGDGTAVAELQSNLRVTLPTLHLKKGDVIQPYLTVKDSFGRTLRVNDNPLVVTGEGRVDMESGNVGVQIVEN